MLRCWCLLHSLSSSMLLALAAATKQTPALRQWIDKRSSRIWRGSLASRHVLEGWEMPALETRVLPEGLAELHLSTSWLASSSSCSSQATSRGCRLSSL